MMRLNLIQASQLSPAIIYTVSPTNEQMIKTGLFEQTIKHKRLT